MQNLFSFISQFCHSLAIFSEKHTLVFCTRKEQNSHKPLSHFDCYAAIVKVVFEHSQIGGVKQNSEIVNPNRRKKPESVNRNHDGVNQSRAMNYTM